MTSSESPTRVAVAMSGGVDSSLVAWMLREAGHDVFGLFMRNGAGCSGGASDEEDALPARRVAEHLGIGFEVVDLKERFEGRVIDHFLDEYTSGRTPNPCATCNREIKFGELLGTALALGGSAMATGHYARSEKVDGRVHLRRGTDPKKDQSYVLFHAREEKLAHALFPLGELTKPEVRRRAAEAGLPSAQTPESQDICFVPSNDYRGFLAERGVVSNPGEIVDTGGGVLGRHEGTERFTIGQRRGLGVALGEPRYVLEIEPKSARVVLGTKEECSSDLLIARQPNWIGFDPPASGEFTADVQIRYHHAATPARILLAGDEMRVEFDAPQLAVAPGQGAALYRGDRLLGGGWIERGERRAR